MKALLFALRVVAVTVVFFLAFMIAVNTSGLSDPNLVQPPAASATPSNAAPTGPAPLTAEQAQAQAAAAAKPFFVMSLLAGLVFAWLIQRSAWRGLKLTAAVALAVYGLGTVVAQVESLVYLRDKLPIALIERLFVVGAIQAVLFAPLAVLIMGRAFSKGPAVVTSGPKNLAARIAVLAVAYVCLYYVFGYYVAWQSPAVRQFYAGTTEIKGFFAQLASAWTHPAYMLPLQLFRGALWALCALPVVRALRTSRAETVAIVAALFGVWSFMLFIPNPYMPAGIARMHFWETLFCDLILGGITGYTLRGETVATPAPVATASAA